MSQMPTERQWGYCANVHPGRTLDQVKQNLELYSLDVKRKVSPSAAMGIGLWLSSTAIEQLNSDTAVDEFRDWLGERGLIPFTLNGFPFGDFHQDVVKHEVYLPTWADPQRLAYTLRLAAIQDRLLPAGSEATISTLPIGWPNISDSDKNDAEVIRLAALNLRECATQLDHILATNGRLVRVAIEPEPGCMLDTAEDVVRFFTESLLTGESKTDEMILRHITICHDVCHSAVMFEEQSHAIQLYRERGIRIGKVQVSSAVEVDFDGMDAATAEVALEQLREFDEPKYLHQTCVRRGKVEFFEDLSLALQTVDSGTLPSGVWRVHFHVPVFAEAIGAMGTTQAEISKCLKHVGDEVTHFEIETYAWGVLPDSQRQDSLADGIAKELAWFKSQAINFGS